MTFFEKLKSALASLECYEPKIRGYQPPLFRLLWALGAEVPPPHFLTFTENRRFAGFFMSLSILICCIVWLGVVRESSWTVTLLISIPAALLSGFWFGHEMAKHYERKAKLYNIPQWKDYHPEKQQHDS